MGLFLQVGIPSPWCLIINMHAILQCPYVTCFPQYPSPKSRNATSSAPNAAKKHKTVANHSLTLKGNFRSIMNKCSIQRTKLLRRFNKANETANISQNRLVIPSRESYQLQRPAKQNHAYTWSTPQLIKA